MNFDKIDLKKELIISYKKLTSYLDKLDPIKLISQMTLTYLFYPAKPGEEFKPEYDEIYRYSRYIEFISGYYLKSKYPISGEDFIDGRVLDKIEKLCSEYFSNFSMYHSTFKKNLEPSQNSLLYKLRLQSIFVRGDSFPEIQINYAKDIYNYHNEYFMQKFGFKIQDAIEIYFSLNDEIVKRVNSSIKTSKIKSDEITNSQIEKNQELISQKDNISTSNFFKLLFMCSDIHLSFTIEEMVGFTKKKSEICKSFIKKFSQSFGFRNKYFPNTFENPMNAGLDYNTLYERPIISYNDKYFIPILPIFSDVLLNTFHYDLIKDKEYSNIYNDKRGKWLECKTHNLMKSVFKDNVILNPFYPNKEELADILVLYDRKIIIIQCKSKSLTLNSKKGEDFDSLKCDIKKGIKNAQKQAIKAKEYFLNNENPKIINNNVEIEIDMNQVSDILILCVTFGYYKSLLTKISDINDALNLFNSGDKFWALAISDLEVITEIINQPYEFIHYFKQRLNIEEELCSLSADEVDLLNVYLDQGLDFNINHNNSYDYVSLVSYSNEIDKYFYNKFHKKNELIKPKKKRPEKLNLLINDIAGLQTSYFSDCIDKILHLNYKQQEQLIEDIFKINKNHLPKYKIRATHFLNRKDKTGISYFACNLERDINRIYQQAYTNAMLYKYKYEFDYWVVIAKDVQSIKLADLAFFVSFPWQKDEVIEQMVEKHNFKEKSP